MEDKIETGGKKYTIEETKGLRMVKIFLEKDALDLERALIEWLNGADDLDCSGCIRERIPSNVRRSIIRTHTHNSNLIVFYSFI